MTLIYGDDKDDKVDMTGYTKESVEEFTDDCTRMVTSPAALHLFEVNGKAEQLNDTTKAKLFHRIVAKLLFVSNRGRPDIQVPIAFLTTRTHSVNDGEFEEAVDTEIKFYMERVEEDKSNEKHSGDDSRESKRSISKELFGYPPPLTGNKKTVLNLSAK